MTEYCHIVPWFDSNEWHKVYNKIYIETSIESKQEALKLLRVWKLRCPSLPSGIESTLTLLEVHTRDQQPFENGDSGSLLRLAYSSGILRFVNNMLDIETIKGTSFYDAARNLGIPDWVIDLRHDAAHSNNLPSLEILREASLIALDWLKINYWDKYRQYIRDYIVGQMYDDIDSKGDKIATLMNFCILLGFCSYSRKTNLAKVPDPLRETILDDAMSLFGDSIDLSDLKRVSINSLIIAMNVQGKKMLKGKDITSHVNKALLGKESLIISLEVFYYLNGNKLKKRRTLNKQYMQCFDILLTFLHSNDLILAFILELIKVTEKNEENKTSHLAALWVFQILRALKNCRDFIKKITRTDSKAMCSKKRSELIALFHHWYPNEKHTLLLDLRKSVPKELEDINFIEPIIKCYNPYLTYFIKNLLDLLNPQLPEAACEQICDLAKIVASPEKFPCEFTKIYTVEDIKQAEQISSPRSPEKEEDVDSDCVEIIDQPLTIKDDQESSKFTNSIWQLSSTEHDWSKCPIGVLPWQLKDDQAEV